MKLFHILAMSLCMLAVCLTLHEDYLTNASSLAERIRQHRLGITTPPSHTSMINDIPCFGAHWVQSTPLDNHIFTYLSILIKPLCRRYSTLCTDTPEGQEERNLILSHIAKYNGVDLNLALLIADRYDEMGDHYNNRVNTSPSPSASQPTTDDESSISPEDEDLHYDEEVFRIALIYNHLTRNEARFIREFLAKEREIEEKRQAEAISASGDHHSSTEGSHTETATTLSSPGHGSGSTALGSSSPSSSGAAATSTGGIGRNESGATEHLGTVPYIPARHLLLRARRTDVDPKCIADAFHGIFIRVHQQDLRTAQEKRAVLRKYMQYMLETQIEELVDSLRRTADYIEDHYELMMTNRARVCDEFMKEYGVYPITMLDSMTELITTLAHMVKKDVDASSAQPVLPTILHGDTPPPTSRNEGGANRASVDGNVNPIVV